uniref:SCAN box domain-containing protein n=1 Tax=Lepisosteus oculatus TaxID=7918 RepID=W5N3Y7_LEPOC
ISTTQSWCSGIIIIKRQNNFNTMKTSENTSLSPSVRVRPGRYDGEAPWETYEGQFQLAARTNGWSRAEMAGHLAVALEGAACQVLLDVLEEDRGDYTALAAALQLRFGVEEAPDLMWERLALQRRRPGERLGPVAADVMFLARRGYPTFPREAQREMALQAFLKALSPEELLRHVQLAAPTSLEQALALATRAEAVFGVTGSAS